jgi:hypothetical protein
VSGKSSWSKRAAKPKARVAAKSNSPPVIWIQNFTFIKRRKNSSQTNGDTQNFDVDPEIEGMDWYASMKINEPIVRVPFSQAGSKTFAISILDNKNNQVSLNIILTPGADRNAALIAAFNEFNKNSGNKYLLGANGEILYADGSPSGLTLKIFSDYMNGQNPNGPSTGGGDNFGTRTGVQPPSVGGGYRGVPSTSGNQPPSVGGGYAQTSVPQDFKSLHDKYMANMGMGDAGTSGAPNANLQISSGGNGTSQNGGLQALIQYLQQNPNEGKNAELLKLLLSLVKLVAAHKGLLKWASIRDCRW